MHPCAVVALFNGRIKRKGEVIMYLFIAFSAIKCSHKRCPFKKGYTVFYKSLAINWCIHKNKNTNQIYTCRHCQGSFTLSESDVVRKFNVLFTLSGSKGQADFGFRIRIHALSVNASRYAQNEWWTLSRVRVRSHWIEANANLENVWIYIYIYLPMPARNFTLFEGRFKI